VEKKQRQQEYAEKVRHMLADRMKPNPRGFSREQIKQESDRPCSRTDPNKLPSLVINYSIEQNSEAILKREKVWRCYEPAIDLKR
jgi:hypothetical protein